MAVIGVGTDRQSGEFPAFQEAAGAHGEEPPVPPRRLPRTRGDCLPGGSNEERPCIFYLCRYNTANLGTRRKPSIPGLCVLDMADDGPKTLAEIATIAGLSRERVRQIEATAIRKVIKRLGVRP